MAQHSAIQTLIELANKEAERLAERLGAALRNHQENEQKLTVLQQYREDYSQRYEEGMAAGLGISNHHNFRVFLAKLDEAIIGQLAIVRQLHTVIETERQAWQTAERKRMSFDTLAQRAQQQAYQQTVRRDQKSTDEFASRALTKKPHPYDPSIGHE
ncbi:MAG: flagellar export protein FliJ [Burkholderiales bacterium]